MRRRTNDKQATLDALIPAVVRLCAEHGLMYSALEAVALGKCSHETCRAIAAKTLQKLQTLERNTEQ